jgi:membrane protein
MAAEQGSELWSRSLGFATLRFLTLVPLLIIVSSADPEHGWGLGVSTASGRQVEQLFIRPGKTLRTVTTFGIAALCRVRSELRGGGADRL